MTEQTKHTCSDRIVVTASGFLSITYYLIVLSILPLACRKGDSPSNVYGQAPTLTLISPNGGETWKTGFLTEIRWSTTKVIGNFIIELSWDSGVSYQPIIDSTRNDDAQAWFVLGPANPNSRVRITSLLDSTVSDASDGLFSIVASPPPSFSGEYFPVSIGSQWVYVVYDSLHSESYRRIIRSVDTTRMADGNLAYVWLTQDTAGNLVSSRPDSFLISIVGDTVRGYWSRNANIFSNEYVIPLTVGLNWPYWNNGLWCLDPFDVEDQETVNVPAGEYHFAFRLYYLDRCDEGNSLTRWFVPYVGAIKQRYWGRQVLENTIVWQLENFQQ